MSKIISLKAENVKRLKAVRIEPGGDPVVIISGKNGAGKSAVLDCIDYIFRGKRSQPKRPIRDGQKKATMEAITDDLVVARTITPSGGSLIVTNREGLKYNSPQKILDAMQGQLTFDPQEFARMEAGKQLATLKQLAGLDFAEQDDRRASLYSQRTEANREIKRLEASVLNVESFKDVPSEPVSVDDLAAEIERINRGNNDSERAARDYKAAKANIAALTEGLKRAKQDLMELEGKLAPRVDPAPLIEKMKRAHEINQKVQSRKENQEREAQLETLQADAGKLTIEINGIDESKEELLGQARFPVEGLGLDDDGVTYGGIPFEQASTSERIRVSVAMGLAMNPKLRVLLIRNGNDLDADNLELVRSMAAEADAQVWIERIDATGDVAVVIEDGEVAG